MNIRRVVTGHDANGKSVFASDEEVPGLAFEVLPGWRFFDVWGADETPTFPDAGEKPEAGTYFPGVGGFRFSFSVIPPESTPPAEGIDEAAAMKEVNAALPGMMDHLEPDGMHTTDTVDMEVIISGEVSLILDDGEEKVLRAGDTVVQNGTRHVWRVRGDEPCLMAVFMFGANRAGA
ncbi:cupin [Nocardioides flavus (ex Wang et al. 2016)]|uniref:Cupin n=1 Tax=Nocardioides flavus (ex Wang et al. 2016) TaxID=2058780 RepID=A0ABQ3HLN9_9ACTN|nr:cupin [Nocardioides flavus (ex Wang et al. 2016)]